MAPCTGHPMRKPRDFDAELKALQDKAKEIRARRVEHFGELLLAAAEAEGVDVGDHKAVMGMLLRGFRRMKSDGSAKEAFAREGEEYFQVRTRARRHRAAKGASQAADARTGAGGDPDGAQPDQGSSGPS